MILSRLLLLNYEEFMPENTLTECENNAKITIQAEEKDKTKVYSEIKEACYKDKETVKLKQKQHGSKRKILNLSDTLSLEDDPLPFWRYEKLGWGSYAEYAGWVFFNRLDNSNYTGDTILGGEDRLVYD